MIDHHHHHQITDLGGIMSITSVFTIGPFVPCTFLCKILNMPVMSICLVKQNDRTWVEKHQRFLFNVYKRFLFLSRFLRFLTFYYFFLKRFFYIYGSDSTSVITETHWKIIWPIASLSRSLTSAIYDFLLTFHSNHGPISHRFRDKRRFRPKIAYFSQLLCI